MGEIVGVLSGKLQQMDRVDKIKIDYLRAVRVLNSMQDTVHYGSWTDRKTRSVNMLLSCLERVGIAIEAVDRLNVIHVTGTKGKGSTCAYVDSILRQYRDDVTSMPRFKTGIFRERMMLMLIVVLMDASSPHLVEVRERIRIDGKPVSMELFTDTFWDVFDRLQATKAKHEKRMPGYFGVTLLMALRLFLQEHVDAVVLEVGRGGEYDATNFVRRPTVCGVASLHLEHTHVLGNTVEEIAWHKAGIMKEGVPMVTTRHQDSVMNVIRCRALEIGKRCPVVVTPELSCPVLAGLGGPLGIAGDRQPINAALAVQLCRIFIQREAGHSGVSQSNIDEERTVEITDLSQEEKLGLLRARLPGRNQVVRAGGVTYFLDGAHTTDSMRQCVQWFRREADLEREALGKRVKRSLVFRMDKKKTSSNHFPFLQESGVQFERAAFCPHVISTTARGDYPDSMDIAGDPEEALQTAETQRRDWVQQLAGAQGKGGGGRETGVEARAFPSIASALWWAAWARDTSLRGLALRDLQGHSRDHNQGGDKSPGSTNPSRGQGDKDPTQGCPDQGQDKFQGSGHDDGGDRSPSSTNSCRGRRGQGHENAAQGCEDQSQDTFRGPDHDDGGDRNPSNTNPSRGPRGQGHDDAGQGRLGRGPDKLQRPVDDDQGLRPTGEGAALESPHHGRQGPSEARNGMAEEGADSHVQVLVTGSLVMVGGALTLLQPDLWD